MSVDEPSGEPSVPGVQSSNTSKDPETAPIKAGTDVPASSIPQDEIPAQSKDEEMKSVSPAKDYEDPPTPG